MRRARRKRTDRETTRTDPKSGTGPNDHKARTTAGHPTALLSVLLILVAVIVGLTHRRTLTAQALSMNDGDYVTQNDRVQNPSWANAGLFLSEVTKPSTVRGYYQPLAMISLMLDSAMGGRPDNLQPYHRTSLALHVANTALLVVLMYLLFGQPWVAALVGLIFGVHPMTVEAVTWLGERKTPLATFFALGCLVQYVRHARRRGWKRYAACLATFVLALMSKPTVTPLPALLLLLDYWPLRRLDRRAVVEKLPFLAIAGVFAVITIISQRHMQLEDFRELSFAQTVLLVCHNVVFYPLKMVWPAGLSSVYPFPEPIGLSNPMVLAGVIGAVLIIPTLVVSTRWTRALLVGWLFFLIALLPTLMNIGYAFTVAADKYAYLPSIGLLLILASCLHGLGRTPSLKLRPPVGRAAALLVVALVAAAQARATHRYLARWQDTESYCRHILTVAPDTSWVHNMLGRHLLDHDRIPEARQHCAEAVRLDPESAQAHINLGLTLTELQELDPAVDHFEQALELTPDSAQAHKGAAHNGLAMVWAARHEFAKAVHHFEQARKFMPASAEVYNNLANALAAQGKLDDAIAHFETSLQLAPDAPETHYNLAIALAMYDEPDRAVRQFRRAMPTSDDADAHARLGQILASRDRLDQAITHFEASLRTRPDSAETHFNLGCALAARNRLGQAVLHFQKTLDLEPDVPQAHFNLARALAAQDKIDGAIAHFEKTLRLKPDSVEVHCELGDLLLRRGRTLDAVSQYRAALDIDPHHARARSALDAALANQPPSTGLQ